MFDEEAIMKRLAEDRSNEDPEPRKMRKVDDASSERLEFEVDLSHFNFQRKFVRDCF
jgi:hypothetical protein